MSMLNTAVDSAIAIAERRSGKLGASVYSGRTFAVIERAFMALKSSTWFVVASGFSNACSVEVRVRMLV